MGYASGVDDGGQAQLGIGNQLPTDLISMLSANSIQPGSEPSYQLCKTIFAYHPLGLVLAQAPCQMAQSQAREISIEGSPERELQEAFAKEWKSIKADKHIRHTATLARVYGIASLAVIEQSGSTETPLNLDTIAKKDLAFNILDPLNTAGSLVLNQNPNDFEYMKPNYIRVGAKTYHGSRTVIVMNEQPIYIEWTNSAFGFVGRSVYQRSLFPLKSFIQTMITDDAVAQKAALLVAKLKAPGSTIDQQARFWFGFKRQAIKGAVTGNVVSVGIDESIESIDLKNLRDAAEFSRENILKNIATAAGMPATIINKETLTAGFGEGENDMKLIAQFIDDYRIELSPLYDFFDLIVQRRAWNEDFYASLQRKYPEQYGGVPYETAFFAWKNAFKAVWPNFLTEPDSKKAEGENNILKAAIGVYEALAPTLDPENRAVAASWLSDVINDRKIMFSSQLVIDEDAMAKFVPDTFTPVSKAESDE